MPIKRKRKVISPSPSEKGDDNDGRDDAPPTTEPVEPGNDEPCLPCVLRATMFKGFKCRRKKDDQDAPCRKCKRYDNAENCVEIPSAIRDVLLEFWDINRQLALDQERTEEQKELALNVARVIENYQGESQDRPAMQIAEGVFASASPPIPAAAGEKDTNAVDRETRLTDAIKAHTAAVEQHTGVLNTQTEILGEVRDAMTQIVDHVSWMTDRIIRNRTRRSNRDDLAIEWLGRFRQQRNRGRNRGNGGA